jgi:hypothetical protein
MTPTANEHHNDLRGQRRPLDVLGPRHRPTPRLGRTMLVTAAVVGLLLTAAGCGGSKAPGAAGGSSSAVFAKFLAYSRCVRSHGISDYPDPTTSPGGGVAIKRNGGPGSDLNRNNPAFKAATQACRSLAPTGTSGPPPQSAQKIAAEVKWAHCMRAHGLPSFPDPDAQGAFDRNKFNENTPAFQTASKACQSLMNAVGPVPVY